DQTRFTHRCLVPESVAALRGLWTGWELQLLLADMAGPRAAKSTSAGDPASPLGVPTPDRFHDNRATAAPAPSSSSHERPSSPSSNAAHRPAGPPSPSDQPEPSRAAPRSKLPSSPPWRPDWTARPTPPGPDSSARRLAALTSIPAPARLAALEEMAASLPQPPPESFTLLLAHTLYETGQYERAAGEFARTEAPEERRALYLARYAESLLLSGRSAETRALVAEDEPDPAARGMLGIALVRDGFAAEALPHLRYAWDAPEARRPPAALALARLLWARGDEEAAAPYAFLFTSGAEDLAALDYLAMAELAELDAFGAQAWNWQLTFIERFHARADPAARAAESAKQLAYVGLDLARRLGDDDRLFHAYQQVLDDIMRRPVGDAGDLPRIIEHIAADHHGGRLAGAQCFDLLEECLPSLKDYPQVLRGVLIAAFEDLLGRELEAFTATGTVFPPYVKDLDRALHRLKSKGAVVEAYKQAVAARPAGAPSADLDEAPRAIAGKRVALVGGHDRTRQLVRERLRGWGAAVDEVPPPTAGRVSEREMLDRVRSSDLIVLIVTYMGHDMSTIVSNLKHREALRGTVLPVECRGVSGVCRAIRDWAEGVTAWG
ncbi:MAG: hypothetical protein ACRDG4_15750, partial [Chloroflexota bacterium]